MDFMESLKENFERRGLPDTIAIEQLEKNFNPIANNSYSNGYSDYKTAVNTPQEVNRILHDCNDLIDPRYKAWFAKRFARIDSEMVYRLASQARTDAKDGIGQRLFTHLIKANYYA